MANLVRWIEEDVDGEEIEAVVIGEMGWGDYGSDEVPNYSQQPKFKVISWEEAKRWLDYEFSDGYGAPNCNAIYAWTKSWIVAVSQYDGSTTTFRLPRNPVECRPYMPGG